MTIRTTRRTCRACRSIRRRATTRARAEDGNAAGRDREGVDPRVGAESSVVVAAATAEPCHLSRSSAPEPSALGSLHDAKVLPPALNARSAQRRVCRLLCWQHVAMAAAFRRTQAALTWLKRCSKEVSTSTAIGHRSMQQEKDRRRRRSYVQVSN